MCIQGGSCSTSVMYSALSSRLCSSPFPVRKLREMSAGLRSLVNLGGLWRVRDEFSMSPHHRQDAGNEQRGRLLSTGWYTVGHDIAGISILHSKTNVQLSSA